MGTESIFVFSLTKTEGKKLEPIKKYCHFSYRVNETVEVNLDFAAKLIFGPDVTSIFVG